MLELLPYLLNRENYLKYRKYVPEPQEVVLKRIFSYLDEMSNELARDLQFGEFSNYVLACWPNVTKSDKDTLELAHVLLKKLSEVCQQEDSAQLVLERIRDRENSYKLAELYLQYSDGKITKEELIERSAALAEPFTMTNEDEDPFVSETLSELADDRRNHPGLSWRLQSLNRSIGPLRTDFGFIFARPEVGKCFAKGTHIMMFDGSVKEVQDVREGDLVMGPDSSTRRVFGCTSGVEELFKVSYPHGDSYTVNKSHILSLRNKQGKVVNVSVADYLEWGQSKKAKHKGYKTGLDFYDTGASSDIPPYLLGMWLGDGTAANTSFTLADEELIRECQHYAEYYRLSCCIFERINQGKAKTVALSNKKGKKNPLREMFRLYNLLNNKHIPEAFLYTSRESRSELLAGLIDTDGYYTGTGYEIVQVRKELATQILWLVRSLGLHGTMRPKMVNGKTYWRVVFYGDCSSIPVRLPRKKFVKKATAKRKNLNFSIKVESVGNGDYYGFCVDGDHLFLLDDFTVVHNTTFLCAEGSHMLHQLLESNGGPLLWINNEEESKKVKSRFIQSWFGVTAHELWQNSEDFSRLFEEQTQGKFLITRNSTTQRYEIERLIKQTQPGLIICDALDALEGFKADREDLRLGSIFKWAQEVSKAQQCPFIGVTWADGTAEGVKYLHMGHVTNAKTEKQKPAGFILGIGSQHDDRFQSVRHFYVSKNKLDGGTDSEESMRHAKIDVLIKPEIARFEDI